MHQINANQQILKINAFHRWPAAGPSSSNKDNIHEVPRKRRSALEATDKHARLQERDRNSDYTSRTTMTSTS